MIRSRRLRSYCLVALALPVFALRGLIPAGFMTASVGGGIQIVLCEPGVMAGGHHHNHHRTPGSAPGAMDPTCPFAQSSGPALLPVLPVIPVAAAAHRLEQAALHNQTQLAFGPPRQQTPRGPPTRA